MVAHGRPVEELRQLAARGASGELICVTSSFEVHVFLQAGRVAWATDSTHAFAFAAHLQETAGVDAEAFRQVVEECRRERLPLGETLVSWGLVSWDAVRASLLHQIRQAIALVASAALPMHVLFLERKYAGYNDRLTFSFDEFSTAAESVERGQIVETVEALGPLSHRPGLARQLHDTIEGLSHVAILDGCEAVDAHPAGTGPWVPGELLRTTLLDGATFVAVRSTHGSIVGLPFARSGHSMWCRLDADSTFGAIVSALSSMLVSPDLSAERPPRRRDTIAWAIGPRAASVGDEVESFMRRAQELLCVLLLPETADDDPLFGCGTGEISVESGIDVARRRAAGLARWRFPELDAREERLSSIGYFLRTIVTGESGLWCFGAELGVEGETLWLFTDRRTSQGLGWAYLSSLTRSLSRLDQNARP